MDIKYNWPAMVMDMRDSGFMIQEEMAERFNVSQQSISNWLNGTRNPGIRSIPKLLKLARDIGLDVGKYVSDPAKDRIGRYVEKHSGRELIRIFDLFARMSRGDRKKFLLEAERLSKRK